MILLAIEVTQVGGYLVMKYHAGEDSTSTEPERQEVRNLIGCLQERIAKDGGKGSFVEKHPGAGN